MIVYEQDKVMFKTQNTDEEIGMQCYNTTQEIINQYSRMNIVNDNIVYYTSTQDILDQYRRMNSNNS